jgi:hypothetical protein
MDWPLWIALLLIVLKQAFKLLLFNRPDGIDAMKAMASLPLDVSFLIVSLFFKAAASGTSGEIVTLLAIYIISSLVATVLWRVSDRALINTVGLHFIWACPLNFAFSGTTLYLAIQYVSVT